jgi:hypothetical protein
MRPTCYRKHLVTCVLIPDLNFVFFRLGISDGTGCKEIAVRATKCHPEYTSWNIANMRSHPKAQFLPTLLWYYVRSAPISVTM